MCLHTYTIVTVTHCNTQMFGCNTCSAVYSSRSDLYKHYEAVHQHKLFYCDYCSKPFTRRRFEIELERSGEKVRDKESDKDRERLR